jgi:hypothetical protein
VKRRDPRLRRPRPARREGDEGEEEAEVVEGKAVQFGKLPIDDADSALVERDQVRRARSGSGG